MELEYPFCMILKQRRSYFLMIHRVIDIRRSKGLLNDSVRLILTAWWVRYGGGPPVARKVINSGVSKTELSVEVYPLRLQLHFMPKGDRATTRISKKVSICFI